MTWSSANAVAHATMSSSRGQPQVGSHLVLLLPRFRSICRMTGPDNQLFQEARVMVNEEKVLLRLVDTLLPGGAGFPAASSTGMTQQVAARLHLVDANLLTRLAAVFAALGGLPQDEPGWCDATSRLEALEPKLFDEIRKYTYLTYYEQPAVIEAIRALGFHYNDAPL